MVAQVPRYVIETNLPDKAATQFMFSQAVRVCRELGIKEVSLLVGDKGQFRTTEVGLLLGSDGAGALCFGRRIPLQDGILLALQSLHRFDQFATYGLLIGVYLSTDGLDKLDSASRAQAIMFFPWTEKEGKAWLSTWDATVLGQREWCAEPLQLDPGVEGALAEFADEINLSKGLCRPADRQLARGTFADLKKRGLRYDPEHVRWWALRNGFQPRDANHLKEMAQKSL